MKLKGNDNFNTKAQKREVQRVSRHKGLTPLKPLVSIKKTVNLKDQASHV
jgi:hypothetical protein